MAEHRFNLMKPVRISISPVGHKVLPSGVTQTLYARDCSALHAQYLPRPAPLTK
jgi:hypothetical protein